MKHYFCESCNGVDTVPHVCRTEGCPKQGQPLTEHNVDDVKAHQVANEKWQQENKTKNP